MADATFGDPVAQVSRLVRGGCRVIQLRCKGWPPAVRARAARAALGHTRPHDVLLIINDDISCAAEVRADGVHLGQGDGPIGLARAALGPDAWVGRSTHDDAELAAAQAEGADYVGFGPIFPTTTKQTGFSTRGLIRLAAAARAFPGPVIAIGGIGPAHVQALIAAGAHGWAVGAGVWRSPDPDAAIRQLGPETPQNVEPPPG